MKKRLISLILVLIMLVAVIASCKKKPQGSEDSVGDSVTDTSVATEDSAEDTEEGSESDTDADTEEDTETETEEDSDEETESEETVFSEIRVEELSNYAIVYPEDAGADMKTLVSTLAAALDMKFGVMPDTKTDIPEDYMGNSMVGEYEIIIGDTRREESAQLLSELEYGDRGYALIGKKLVIAAHDPTLVASTVSEFSSLVRKMNAKDEVFFNTDMNKIIRGSYRYGTIVIDGVDISEYSIVYPNGKSFEKNLAQKLWRSIAEECGSLLPVISDKEAASGREIIIGKTARPIKTSALSGTGEKKGIIVNEGGSICLCGNTAMGNAIAVESFIDSYSDGEKTESLTLKVENRTVADNSSLSSMTFNVDSKGYSSANALRVVETIVRYLPDTVGLQDCSANWKKNLTSNLSDYYEYVGIGRDEGGTGLASAILYAKNKFTLVDSGTKWLSETPDTVSAVEGSDANYTFAYVVLRAADGTEYMHINTQLGANGAVRTAQARLLLDFIYENRDKAIILTGDLNCVEGSVEFNSLVCEFMRHAAAISEDVLLGSFTKKNISDTVLVYDKYMDVSYMEVAYKRIDGAYASTSYAAYVEFSIDYNGTEFTETGVTGDGLVWYPDREGEGYPPFIPFE